MHIYTPDPSNNPATITEPDDGDLEDAASVDIPFEDLADKVAHANWPETDNTKKYPLASRTLARVQARLPLRDLEANWTYIKNPGAYEAQTNTAVELYHELDLPDGCTLTAVECWLKGAPTDVASPATRPTMTIYKIDITANSTTILSGPISDTPVLVTYLAFHQISTGTISSVIDRTKYRYIAVFTSEAGLNSNAGLRYFGCRCYFTVTEQDPGAA